jgi:hypothetical protein
MSLRGVEQGRQLFRTDMLVAFNAHRSNPHLRAFVDPVGHGERGRFRG